MGEKGKGQKEKNQLQTYLNTQCQTIYTTQFLFKRRNCVISLALIPALSKDGTINTVRGEKEGVGAAFPPIGSSSYEQVLGAGVWPD